MATQPYTNIHNRLVKVKEAADYLAISERKLWDLTNSGIIPVVRLGRAVRYDLADLNKFIENMKNDSKD